MDIKLSFDAIIDLDHTIIKKLMAYMHIEYEDPDLFVDFSNSNILGNMFHHKIIKDMIKASDFKQTDGLTIIDRFLIESEDLTEVERFILQQRSSSYTSLYEVIDSDETTGITTLLDLFSFKTYQVYDYKVSSFAAAGDYVITRIGTIGEISIFFGEYNPIPQDIKDALIEIVLKDFNRCKLKADDLDLSSYLKIYGWDLKSMVFNYTNNNPGFFSDASFTHLYSQIDEFDTYISQKHSELIVNQYCESLIEFYDYYLDKRDYDLSDIDKVNLTRFFETAIDDGFIISQEDLNSFIGSIKAYISFLLLKNKKYSAKYAEIVSISENRFNMLTKLNSSSDPLLMNKEFSKELAGSLSEVALDLISDLDKFLLYITTSTPKHTISNKHLNIKALDELNDMMINYTNINSPKPRQKDYSVLNLFFYFSLEHEFFEFKSSKIHITNKGMNFFRLNYEDKYSCLFFYVWSGLFLENVLPDISKDSYSDFVEDFVYILHNSSEKEQMDINLILERFKESKYVFISAYTYFQILGLVQISLFPKYTITMTDFSRKIILILDKISKLREKPKIINLIKYKIDKKNK